MKITTSLGMKIIAATLTGGLSGAVALAADNRFVDYRSKVTPSGYSVTVKNNTGYRAQCTLSADGGRTHHFILPAHDTRTIRINDATATYTYRCA